MDESTPYTPNDLTKGLYKSLFKDEREVEKELCSSVLELSSITERYTLLSPLGSGAIKEVSRCLDHKAKRKVAYARPKAELSSDYYDYFIHEAWLTSSLQHPNIIKIHDIDVDPEGRPFFTMDLKGNISLQDLATSESDLRKKLHVFMKVCDALSYAHSKGVIHLDLKPENIQCDAHGEVLVCDWGLGKSLRKEEAETLISQDHLYISEKKTLYGEIRGSLGYMAPEQAQGDRMKNEKTDIYALGCLLYFLVTGKPPYEGSKEEIIKETIAGQIPHPRLQHPELNIPKSIEAIILKATQKDPQNRYPHTRALQDDLFLYLEQKPVSVERPTLFRKTQLFYRRHMVISTISLLSLLSLTLISIIYTSQLKNTKKVTELHKERGDTLEEEISSLNGEYESVVKIFSNSQEELAIKMSHGIRNLIIKSGKKEDPRHFLEKAEKNINNALAINPDSEPARAVAFQIHCLKMDFQKALTIQFSPERENEMSYHHYASLRPDFSYSEETRPSISDLVSFLDEARDLLGKKPVFGGDREFLMQMMRFDYHSRKDRIHYAAVIAAAIRYCHEDSYQLTAQYDPASRRMVVSTKEKLKIMNYKTQRSLLSYVTLRELHLSLPYLNLTRLKNSTIQHLDVSESTGVHCNPPVFINRLETLSLNENILEIHGENYETYFRDRISSNSEYQIILKKGTPKED